MSVVVTGLGIVSSVGSGKDDFWKNIISGETGISEVSSFDTTGYRTHRGAEVKDFDPTRYMKNPDKRGRATQFILAAFSMALEDASLDLKAIPKDEVSVISGTTMAEAQVIEDIDKTWVSEGYDKIKPAKVIMGSAHNITNSVCFEHGLMGMSMMLPTACSAGNYAIGFGYDILKNKRAKVVFACTSDSFSRIGFAGFNRLLSMAPNTCRPFDKNRKGMIIGEGAAVLVLEREEDARKRGAYIYSEVLGYGVSCDAYSMTAPSSDGIKRVMRAAFQNAGIQKEDVDYISAHGTGTYSNDRIESQAIKEIYGDLSSKVPVSSIKSMIGHTMGSASSMEAISCCLALRDSIIPPTMNYQDPDPECDLDCVPNKARECSLNIVINNSYAFGGNNCCVVFKRYNGNR